MTKLTDRLLAALALFACAGAAGATVAPPAPAIPALGPAGYLVLASLVGGVGFVVLRRRSK